MSSTSQTMPKHGDAILIVGAGVFGLSHAYELSKRGYSNITVLDRMLPPVPDGSSVDVSRVIRFDYADPFYAALAKEAMKEWQSDIWKAHYHNTGFVLASESKDPHIELCKDVLREHNQPFTSFENERELRARFSHFKDGMQKSSGYVNPYGGWADAAGAIRDLAKICSERGVSFVTGRRGTVTSLMIDGTQVRGVKTAAGSIESKHVILSTGAWTNNIVNASSATSASEQPVAFMQLTEDEAITLKDMTVLINMSSGVFVFPPTPGTNLLKVARHSNGFENEVKGGASGGSISSPNVLSNNAASSSIPDDADTALREGLRYILPHIAEKPWVRRRLCWYSDTAEGNFIVGPYPGFNGLFLACGGAGQ